MKAILFLGTSIVAAKYIEESVQRLGFYPIFLLKLADYSGESRQAIQKCEHYEADIGSLEDIRRVIIENELTNKIAAVTSLLDETLHHACAIAKELHIIGPDPALRQLADKSVVQSMIPEFSPPSLAFSIIEITDSNLRVFFEMHKSFEVFLLKPAISSGGVGISVIAKDATADAIRQLIRNSSVSNPETQKWTIQPRLTGRLYSLEGFIDAGAPNFIGLSRRTRKGLTEIINEFPVDEDIPSDLQKRCKETVLALVNRSGYRNGYFHCEFIIDAANKKTYFIDGNMGRIAGAAIVPQIALYYNKDPVEIYTHVFDLGLFKGSTHSENFSYDVWEEKRTLSVNYCLATPGVVLGVSLPTDMYSFHFRIADNGVYKPGVGESDNAWVGFIAGFTEAAKKDITRIIINTDKGPVSPFYIFEESIVQHI